jgi:hypothetical protein
VIESPEAARPAGPSDAPLVGRRHAPIRRYALVFVALAVVLLYAAFARTRPELLTGPMVQFPSPDRLVVVWEMKARFSTVVVTLTDAHGKARSATVSPVAEASTPDFRGLSRPDSQRYEAAFPDLHGGDEYAYAIENHRFFVLRDAVAGPFTVRTPLPRGRPFRFLAFSDSGVGSNAQSAVAEVMADQKPDLIIHAGDLNQLAGDPTDYPTIFFGPYAALIRSIPLVPVLGNHDCATESGKPLLDFFVLPENGPVPAWKERNFYFDYGDVRFVGLDANKVEQKQAGVITTEQMKTTVAAWLRGVLTNCNARWKIVYYHQPFYTGSTHPPEGQAYFKEAFVGVFEECGVDMAFCGHNHLYERSSPILRDQVVGEGQGVVYITTASAGARRYAMGLPPPYYNRVYNDEVLGFCCVDVTADRLELKRIGDQGQVLDHYVIEKPAATAEPGETGPAALRPAGSYSGGVRRAEDHALRHEHRDDLAAGTRFAAGEDGHVDDDLARLDFDDSATGFKGYADWRGLQVIHLQ